jgi:ribosomal protein S18 acetylase RimI-like enzyme
MHPIKTDLMRVRSMSNVELIPHRSPALPHLQVNRHQWGEINASFPPAAGAANSNGGYAAGSLGEFLMRLQQYGVSPDPILAFAWQLDPISLGRYFCYLQAAALEDGPFTYERLALHLDFARAVHPSQYDAMRRFVREVRHGTQLSSEISRFVETEDVENRLHALLLVKFGLAQYAKCQPRTRRIAHLRSTLTFLENFSSLTGADPNLSLLFQVTNRYGSIQKYYEDGDAPRRGVQRLVELGYNTDHLVFGTEEILSLGPGKGDVQKPWAIWLEDTIRRLLGSRDSEPEIQTGMDRHKFFFGIRADFHALRKNGDENAGVRLVSKLLPELESRQISLLQAGDLIGETQVKQIILELHAIRKQICGDADHLPGQRLVALRSPKLIPELLFDNTRLSCCLFKPNGLFHGEICRLILDPATPLIEFWLEPYPEFLGLATLYAGINARGERTMLMDSIDYNDLLHDLRGYNGTMRFMLDAIVADAHLSGASKIAVVAAPWGKPLGFANFVKQAAARSKAISYRESYYFEAADPEEIALGPSLLGKHHYTEAFGYDSPLIGVIDYSYSLVGWGTVEKLYGGGRGVFEIDVETYLQEHATLLPERPNSRENVAYRAARSLFARPIHHDEELSGRRADSLGRSAKRLAGAVSGVRVEHVPEITPAIIDELLKLEATAFPSNLQYDREHVENRLFLKEATLLAVRAQDELIGFALSYVAPVVSRQDVFLDDLAVHPRLQSKGIGSALLSALIELSAINGYRGVYVSAELSPRLTRFYERLQFQFVGSVPGVGQILRRPVSLLGPERLDAVTAIQRDFERQLKKQFGQPRMTIQRALDRDLLRVLVGLESAFPDDLRYSPEAFRRRMTGHDAHVVVLWEEMEPIACCLSFHDPELPKHAMMIDSLVVRRELQGRGIGPKLFEAVLAILAGSCYTTAFLTCRERNRDGVDLIGFYKSLGATEVGREGDNVRMRVDLRAPRAEEQSGRVAPDRVGATVAPAVNTRRTRRAASATNGKRSGAQPECFGESPDCDLNGLPFIDRAMADQLGSRGIRTVGDLLRRASVRESRQALAAETGIDNGALLRATHFADLVRTGIRPNDLGRLTRFRIKTLDQLRRCTFETLRRALPVSVPDDDIKRLCSVAATLTSAVQS